MYINHQQDNLADWLPMVEFAYNNAVHESMGYSPFFLNRGRHPWALPTDRVAEPRTLAEACLNAIQEVAGKAEACLVKAKVAMKQHWDASKKKAREFQEGDWVLFLVERLPSNWPSRKLDDKWRGPFKVIAKKGPAAYELQLPPRWKVLRPA
jgi:hypothetical protein